ncbi:MAG TPA: cytochrome C oxidase subunit II [Beijerinckiaceae bacterium]|nr:cytochrome C oxidase subunit II [Beijerinckiaceae bacterium]
MPANEEAILRSELGWAAVSMGTVSVIMLAIIYAGVVHHINPPSNIETIDPKTLHLTGEFTEENLGTRIESNGQVTSRIVATQFAFQPQCIVVPANRPVTLRLASPDVIHGILVTGTNVNTMVVPGFVSQVHTVFTKTGDLLMPCHEYCGLGHSQMWATVRVVPEGEFKAGPDGRAGCDAR